MIFRIMAIVAGLGLALGPVLGGVLLSQFWWGAVFLVTGPIVVVALVVGWWAIPESRDPAASRFDPLGVVLSVLSVSALVWATIQAPSQGWGSAATLRLLQSFEKGKIVFGSEKNGSAVVPAIDRGGIIGVHHFSMAGQAKNELL